MSRRGLFAVAVGFVLVVAGADHAGAEGAGDIAPTGALRVAVAVGPAASAFLGHARSGHRQAPRRHRRTCESGGGQAACRCNSSSTSSSDDIAAAGSKDAWDISFIPAEARRAQVVDHGPAYVAYTSSYLLRAGSDIRSSADVDRTGMRVGCIEGTATSRTIARTLQHATLTKFAKADAAADMIGKGELDALAMGTEAVEDLYGSCPARGCWTR